MTDIPSAIYARVSPTKHIKTPEGLHQSLDEAIRICKEDAAREGNLVVKIYIDQYVSGKNVKDMPQFQEMLADARQVATCPWKRLYNRRVDRFGRSWHGSAKASAELVELGYSLKFTEDGVDTDKPLGKGIMSFLFEMAERKRNDIIEDTKRGRERARKEGVVFGCPKKDIDVNSLHHLRKLPKSERPSWKSLRKTFNASPTLLIQRLKDAGYWDEEKGCVK
jgi:DNA invertase Pin-like site-specific DNA recombinase